MSEVLILVTENGPQGYKKLPSMRLYTVEQFFKKKSHPYRANHYLVEVNSGQHPRMLTKQILADRFSEFADTETYQQIMDHPWRK